MSRSILKLLVYTLPGALLAAFCTGWVLAGHALEPLREVGEVIEHVSIDSLGTRLAPKVNEATEIAAFKLRLNDAMARLQQGYEAHYRFISNVAHDLRTPIATVLTESQVIRRTPATIDEYRRYAASIEDEMRRLGRLVESFLLLARAEHGAPITLFQDVALDSLLIEAVQHSTPMARHYHVVIRTMFGDSAIQDGEPIVAGDPDLLRTMIENLLQNAMKFSPRGDIIDAGITVGTDEVVVWVRDRGPGIPAELADTIFERFSQAPSEVLQFRGAGLGLAIARSVAVAHHGRISAHNCEGGGCIFEVFLPRAPLKAEPADGAAEEGQEPKPSAAGDALAQTH